MHNAVSSCTKRCPQHTNPPTPLKKYHLYQDYLSRLTPGEVGVKRVNGNSASTDVALPNVARLITVLDLLTWTCVGQCSSPCSMADYYANLEPE